MLRYKPISNDEDTRRATGPWIWDRFVMNSSELKAIRVSEWYNKEYIAELKGLKGDQMAEGADDLDILEKLVQSNKKGDFIYVGYHQKSFSEYFGEKYRGAKMIGRAERDCFWLLASKKVRNVSFGDTHVELDMRNAMPTMILNAFKDLGEELAPLQEYVNNHDQVIEILRHSVGMTRDEIKATVCKMIGALPVTGIVCDLPESRKHLKSVMVNHQFYRGMTRALQKVCAKVRELYPEVVDAIVKSKMGEGDDEMGHDHRRQVITSHIDGCVIARLCQDMEHVAMRSIIEHLWGDCPEDVMWIYDAILLPKYKIQDQDYDSFCDAMSGVVEKKTNIKVKFQMKSMKTPRLDHQFSKKASISGLTCYHQWKNEFEKTYAVVKNPMCLMRFDPMGDQRFGMGDKNAKLCASEIVDSFGQSWFDRWIEDPQKKSFNMALTVPPPRTIPNDCLNLWDGIAASKIDPQLGVGVDIEPYLKHVRLLMGLDENNTAYFHRLVAYKLQNPGLFWGVNPFIRSIQGQGKDQWFKFISSIIGPKYCLSLSKVGDLFKPYGSHQMADKLMVCFSEVDRKDTKQYMSDIKDFTTNEIVTVDKKHVNSWSVPNSCCYLYFSNDYGGVPVDASDRRFFVVTSNGQYANNPTYHKPLIEWFDTKEAQRAVYDFYMDIDLTGFHPMSERPITEDHKDLAASNAFGLERFFRNYLQVIESEATYNTDRENVHWLAPDVVRISWSRLTEMFTNYATDNKWPSADNAELMKSSLKRFIRQAQSMMDKYPIPEEIISHIPKHFHALRSNSRGFRLIHIPTMKQWLTDIFGDITVDD